MFLFANPYALILLAYHGWRFKHLGIKLGFSIGYPTLGYGVVIPHYGTIVIGGSNIIGNYTVLHTCICISDNGKIIGDAAYVATGVKMTTKITIGNNVSIGANSLVNKNIPDNCMIAGSPAKFIKPSIPWYIRDGMVFHSRVQAVEAIKEKMLK